MENCNHDSHHIDCCVCWWKQAHGMEYENDTTLFMHKVAVLLKGISWKDYCMSVALGTAKDALVLYRYHEDFETLLKGYENA